MTGIYIFKNTKEKKCYIGQSSDLERRKREHYGRSSYQDEFHLNLRENPNNFEYKVLQECLEKELDDLELMWMNWYQNEGWTLYNVCLRKMPNTRGKIPWNKGIPCSEESRKKMSESRKGKHHSEKTKKKISESNKGKNLSEKCRKKISESLKGNIPWNKGKHHSEEAKRKISEAKKGREPWNKGTPCSEEVKKKISESKKGKICSEETRKKMSESMKGKHKGKHWRINQTTGKREWY